MPTAQVNRIDLGKLHPEFLERMLNLVAWCNDRGAVFYAISGYRTPEEQAKLYFSGRTAPGKIVTNARPYRSAHNYGLAVDLCRDGDAKREGLQPDWDLEHYKILADACVLHKLESGLTWASFKEGPHVQAPLSAVNLAMSTLEGRFRKTGMKGAWAVLDEAHVWG